MRERLQRIRPIEVSAPEKFETPQWLEHFIDFITSKDLNEWREKQRLINAQNIKDNQVIF